VATLTGRYTDVGTVADFEVGRMTRVDIPGKDIYVLRTPQDGFFAVKNTCPHHGAPLCLGPVEGTMLPSAPGEYEFGLEYQIVRCPHHAYEYSLETGRSTFVPGLDRVVRYDVEVRDGRVLVSLKGK